MNQNGLLAELKFSSFLVGRGFDVFRPLNPGSPCDFLWRAAPSAAWRSANVKKVFSHRGRPTINLVKWDGTRYRADDVDYIAAVDLDEGYIWMLRLDTDTGRGRKLYELSRLVLGDKWNKYRRKI